MKSRYSYLALLLPVLILTGFKGEDKHSNRKINVNDAYQYIAINNIMMWVSNNGDGSHDPRTDGNGFYWPGGFFATKSAVFEDGLIFGGIVNGQLRVNGNTHRQGLQAGKIINGVPDDPALPKYRVYKITRGWENLPFSPERDAREKDYNEWPIEDGAPYIDIDGDGKPTPGIDKPDFVGDEVLWYVANDMDSVRSTFTYGTLPMGLEFQTTIYGIDKKNSPGDMVFKKYKIINKSQSTVHNMILSYWSDTDLGDYSDDYSGCDTSLNLGYTYNGSNNDGVYGTPPPAMGYKLLQGPIVPGSPVDSARFNGTWRIGYKNLSLTSYVLHTGFGGWGDPGFQYPDQMYNYMSGYRINGEPFINPHTGEETKFVLSGDPEKGTGWYEGAGWPSGPPPSDRRHIMSSGPFNFAPGDTQEIIIALIMAEGSSNINSVTVLKETSRIAQFLHDNKFKTVTPVSPTLHPVSQDRGITLWWEPNAENFQETDPVLLDSIRFEVNNIKYVIPVTDHSYNFEGYKVWQFKDINGTDPRQIAVFDIKNNIMKIFPYLTEYVSFNSEPLVEPLALLPNLGLNRSITVDKDVYTNLPLNNGSEYYFAVTSFAYNIYSDPPLIESVPEIIKVIPGSQPIDFVSPYNTGDIISAQQTAGTGEGEVLIKIVDPDALTGHGYRVIIDDYHYSIFNITLNKYVLEDMNYSDDFESQVVIDGFQVLVKNTAYDSLKIISGAKERSRVKDVIEIKGPGGSELPTPVSVFNKLNSTEKWMIKSPWLNWYMSQDEVDTRQNIDWLDNLGNHDYEIRFTSSGSQFYYTGLSGERPPFNSDYKGLGKVPFEIWDVGGSNLADTAHLRHFIKIWDRTVQNTKWSQDSVTLDWEAFFSYVGTQPYSEPINNTSDTINWFRHKLGNLVINGSLPEPGTVIKVITFKPLGQGDEFVFQIDKAAIDNAAAKQNINNISVFPNPYYAAKAAIGDHPPYLRFTNLPEKAVIRIFSLGGVYITKLEKDERGQYIDWNLRNNDNYTIASGIYLAYIELPGIGTKVMKIAVVQ